MRASSIAPALIAALAASPAYAHGPHIQITSDNNKITTRRLLLDAPFSHSLTLPKSAYVMPLLPFQDVWYSRPNNAVDPILGTPSFFSGPGFAYGYDLGDGGPQAFEAGSTLSLHLTDGLQRWDGAAFSSAGDSQLKAFRGTNVNITSPNQNYAVTSELDPSLSLPTVTVNYGSEGAEIHSSVRYALLGDGTSPTSDSPDGVYLLSLQLSSTQAGLIESDPFYFVLHKNAPGTEVASAVNSLNIPASRVQWVPEPTTAGLLLLGAMCIAAGRGRQRAARL